jgi:hypothetical protein
MTTVAAIDVAYQYFDAWNRHDAAAPSLPSPQMEFIPTPQPEAR